MIKNFNAEVDGIVFEFSTMHAIKLQLFQVYVMHDKKRTRFHMQRNESGNFHITDKAACPEIYLGLEAKFSDLILAHGEV